MGLSGQLTLLTYMKTFQEMNLDWWHYLLIGSIGIIVFIITTLLYPPLIRWLTRKKFIGYDIHKASRPPTAESGGLGLTIGLVFGLSITLFLFPDIWQETFIFIVTITTAAIIGWIDDRKQLRSIVKIALMFITGLPIFIANLYGLKFINIDSPTLPFLGQLQLTIIYPLTIPFIIMIMTNTVNMLEGYNGEGSGTCSIATFFLIIIAIILNSAQGVIYGVILLAALIPFFMVNKYPAKAFPGDIGTLVIGAAIGCMAIFGSLEYGMIVVMLPQIFNSFYVIASVRGFKESHDIKKKDIYQDEDDMIYASSDRGAPLTLPRLIVAHGKMSEPILVTHFLALSVIAGTLAVISILLFPTLEISQGWFFIILILSTGLLIFCWYTFSALRGITNIMIILLLVALFLLWIIDLFIVDTILNWLFGGLIGLIILAVWYGGTVLYFRRTCVTPEVNDTPLEE